MAPRRAGRDPLWAVSSLFESGPSRFLEIELPQPGYICGPPLGVRPHSGRGRVGEGGRRPATAQPQVRTEGPVQGSGGARRGSGRARRARIVTGTCVLKASVSGISDTSNCAETGKIYEKSPPGGCYEELYYRAVNRHRLGK